MGFNCVICGVGGQGNVLASRLIAHVLMNRNEHVKTAETIGMAQRGGCVASHVRGGRPASPLVPTGQADTLIAFEPAEAVRCLSFVKQGGTVVVNTRPVQPTTAALSNSGYDGSEALAYLRQLDSITLIEFDANALCEELGNQKVLNIVMLSVAAKHNALPFGRAELEEAITSMVKERFHALNLDAVRRVFED